MSAGTCDGTQVGLRVVLYETHRRFLQHGFVWREIGSDGARELVRLAKLAGRLVDMIPRSSPVYLVLAHQLDRSRQLGIGFEDPGIVQIGHAVADDVRPVHAADLDRDEMVLVLSSRGLWICAPCE